MKELSSTIHPQKRRLSNFNEGLRKSIQNLAEMIGTKSKWSDILRYIFKCRASDYKLSVDHSGIVHIADHEPEQLEDELSLSSEKTKIKEKVHVN